MVDIYNNRNEFISELSPDILNEAINIMNDVSLNYYEKIGLICQINLHRGIEIGLESNE